MIDWKTGSVLDATENIIAHQCNCKNVFGAGLARQIRNKWPIVYSEYSRYCESSIPLLGVILPVPIDIDNFPFQRFVCNLFGQEDYGRSNKVYTNYTALESALTKLENFARQNNYSVAIPYKIGCGIANGDWSVVNSIIFRVFGNSSVPMTIYKLPEEE